MSRNQSTSSTDSEQSEANLSNSTKSISGSETDLQVPAGETFIFLRSQKIYALFVNSKYHRCISGQNFSTLFFFEMALEEFPKKLNKVVKKLQETRTNKTPNLFCEEFKIKVDSIVYHFSKSLNAIFPFLVPPDIVTKIASLFIGSYPEFGHLYLYLKQIFPGSFPKFDFLVCILLLMKTI